MDPDIIFAFFFMFFRQFFSESNVFEDILGRSPFSFAVHAAGHDFFCIQTGKRLKRGHQ